MKTPLFSFFSIAEKLKTTLRHSWTSDSKRQESVAEHTWMMMLMALVFASKSGLTLDLEKVLKMIVLHDLAEAPTQDLPVWVGQKNKKAKSKAEKKAIKNMLENLDQKLADELMTIWEEYEVRESLEAKFVKMVDTFEVLVQHNLAGLGTWDENDFAWTLNEMQDGFFDLSPELRKTKNELDDWTMSLVEETGKSADVDQAGLKKHKQRKKT